MAAIKTDYRRAEISAVFTAADRTMLDFAIKLTGDPGAMVEEDVVKLRSLGFSDTAIHDIVQVTALFNYYNRLADGLGVDLEPEHPPPAG